MLIYKVLTKTSSCLSYWCYISKIPSTLFCLFTLQWCFGMNRSPSSQHNPHGSLNSFLAGLLFLRSLTCVSLEDIIFTSTYLWVWVWVRTVHECRCPWRTGQRVGSPEARITGCYETPGIGARN